MSKAYVDQRDVYLFAGTGVSLVRLSTRFLSGESGEAIVQAFPCNAIERCRRGRHARVLLDVVNGFEDVTKVDAIVLHNGRASARMCRRIAG